MSLITNPKFQAFDADGNPLTGGLLYTYVSGTTTEKATYTDANMGTANTNPIILDSRGEASVFGAGLYKLVLKSAAGADIWTMDNIEFSNYLGGYVLYVDAAEVDQGVAGNNLSLYAVLTALGTTKKARVVLVHNGTLDTTTYTISTTLNLSAYSNVIFDIQKGAILSIATAQTLTLPSPANINAAPNQQIFSGAGTISFSIPGTVFPDWWTYNATPGTTDMTAAIQAAINSLPVQTHGANIQTTYTSGGGEICLLGSSYLVTDSLLYSGSDRILGLSGLSTYIKFRPTVADTTLFKGNTSRYTRGTTWDFVSFEYITFGGDLFSTGNAGKCLDLSNTSRWNIRRCYCEQFNIALYNSGAGYYHVIDHCELYNNMTQIYHVGGSPIAVLGGVLWNYETDFAGITNPDYLIYTSGKISLHGTSLEPRSAINDADTFASIYLSGSGSVSLHGCYTESFYPLVSIDIDTYKYSKLSVDMLYPYTFPLLRLRNFKSATADTVTDYLQRRHSIDLGMSPKKVDFMINSNFHKGTYGFAIGDGTNYTTALNTGTTFLNKTGVVTATFTDNFPGPGARGTFMTKTILAANLAQYDKQVVTFATLVNLSADISDFRFQVQQTVGGTVYYRYARRHIDYGNGWYLYVTDLKVDTTANLIMSFAANVLSGDAGTVDIAGAFAYVNGWELFPYGEPGEVFSATAAPADGTWARGDVVWNSEPSAGGAPGWVCVTAGTPGTWKAMADLAA